MPHVVTSAGFPFKFSCSFRVCLANVRIVFFSSKLAQVSVLHGSHCWDCTVSVSWISDNRFEAGLPSQVFGFL